MPVNIGRRELILGSAAAWPLAARAQQPAKVPRVGILSPAASETAGTLTAFRKGIRDLGYIEGQTIALDFRLSKGIMDALPALATELVRIPVNVIVTDSTSATLAAFAATRTIPIVMGATGGDPVALGLAKSLSRPGGNCDWRTTSDRSEPKAVAIAQAGVPRHRARRRFGKSNGRDIGLRNAQGREGSFPDGPAPCFACGEHARRIAVARAIRAIG
jgi:ABC transporter substrate binding protein